MIPFNRLGLPFKLFSRFVYPKNALGDISSLLEEVRSESFVLDIGTGTGVLTEFAHTIRNDLKYVSLDPAYGMIKYAPEYAHRTIALAESLPFEKDTFNIVLMGDTIHHIGNPRKALQEIKECMAPSGILFIFDLNPGTFIGSMVCRMERLLNEPVKSAQPRTLNPVKIEHPIR
jgi:ubiquinone/menaquinone biosynthesis C-methylase UbiE